MSSIKSCNTKNICSGVKNPYHVIIKGFMSEPVLMDAKIIQKNIITVSRIDCKARISLKKKYAYHYDENIFNNLKESFRLREFERLESEWQKAKPIIST